MLGLLSVLLTVASIEARIFNNPILSDKKYSNPGVLKLNDTYYVLADPGYKINEKFGIHVSTDLIEWKPAGSVFDESNIPTWAYNRAINFPKIYQIGTNFLVYFSAQNSSKSLYHLGVATAPHPLGPYTSIDRPILSLPNEDLMHPSIINDQGSVYLMWVTNSNEVKARRLNSNGLSFSSDQTTSLLKPDLAWEGYSILYPYYVRRGAYHYLFYNVDDFCDGVGVARSSQAYGPYEKFADPLKAPSKTYKCMRNINIARDLDNKGDVMFFNVGQEQTWVVLVANLSWYDNWPYFEDF